MRRLVGSEPVVVLAVGVTSRLRHRVQVGARRTLGRDATPATGRSRGADLRLKLQDAVDGAVVVRVRGDPVTVGTP